VSSSRWISSPPHFVTDARLLGRLEVDVKVRAAVVADTATGESVDEHFLVDVEEDHGVEIRDPERYSAWSRLRG